MARQKNPAKRKEHVQAEQAAMDAQVESIGSFDLSDPARLEKFEELPLSQATLRGLKSAHFTDLTDIQKECIVPALRRSDLLAAARTGSGKTLGFLVPMLDRLYLERWTQLDGLGAIVITPTRELAMQIFEVLRSIGKFHTLSAGLLIGGKNVQAEKDRVSRLNILIATPGRLLQHMDESPGFDANNLQLLVLDEADRLMDMGFKATVDAIVQNLPPQRQTMLFSATQTKNVSDLARLSLSSPKYISVVDPADPGAVAGSSVKAPTPKTLEQFYTTVPLDEKLDMLWSFLRSHVKSKVLVFLSSSKQVRFVYEAFRRMQPGIPLLHLHGRQKQTARMDTTARFMRARASCLLATDVVARGIDFPEVDWVVQVDCPEDSATYIHRVGRSARAGKSGKALLMLTPDEQPAFALQLEARRIPITAINVRDSKKTSIQPELQAQLFQDPELKYLAQKAFISYVRSVHIQKDKEVFHVEAIPLEAFAKSLGLASAPNVKIKGSSTGASKQAKNRPRALDDARDADAPRAVRTKYERIFQRQNQNVLSEHYQKLAAADDDDDGDFMSIKRGDHDLSDDDNDDSTLPLDGSGAAAHGPESKRAAKRATSKKQASLASGKTATKLVFDDEGKAHALYEFENEEDFQKAGLPEEQRQQFVSGEAEDMQQRDVTDKEVLKQRRQEKKRRRKELERLAMEGGDLSGSESESDDARGLPRLPSASESEADALPSDDDDDEAASAEGAPAAARSDSRQPHAKRRRTAAETFEVEEPETLEDLEALSSRLLGH